MLTQDDIDKLKKILATKEDLRSLAAENKEDLRGLATENKKDLRSLAAENKEDLRSLAAENKEDLRGLATENKKDLKHLASKEDVRKEIRQLERRINRKMDEGFTKLGDKLDITFKFVDNVDKDHEKRIKRVESKLDLKPIPATS